MKLVALLEAVGEDDLVQHGEGRALVGEIVVGERGGIHTNPATHSDRKPVPIQGDRGGRNAGILPLPSTDFPGIAVGTACVDSTGVGIRGADLEVAPRER